MDARIIAISGGTCSGKSTFARRAPTSIVLSTDDYYKDLSEQIRREDGTINWEDPRAVDLNACAIACQALSRGEPVDIPIYDMSTDSRIGFKQIAPKAPGLVVIEGLFAFEPEIVSIADVLIFLDVDMEMRKNRRLARDTELGVSVDKIMRCLHDVQLAEEAQLAQSRKLAHIVLSENDKETYWQIAFPLLTHTDQVHDQ